MSCRSALRNVWTSHNPTPTFTESPNLGPSALAKLREVDALRLPIGDVSCGRLHHRKWFKDRNPIPQRHSRHISAIRVTGGSSHSYWDSKSREATVFSGGFIGKAIAWDADLRF